MKNPNEQYTTKCKPEVQEKTCYRALTDDHTDIWILMCEGVKEGRRKTTNMDFVDLSTDFT